MEPIVKAKKIKNAVLYKNLFLVLVAAAAGFGGGWLGGQRNVGKLTTQNRLEVVNSEGELITEITKHVSPSVVSVSVISETGGGFYGYYETEGAGTGFIISDDGIVVTNRHVVDGAKKVTVTLNDGTQLDNIELIGQTASSDPLDIAFLKIKDAKGKKLTPATLGDSGNMEVGDRVIAIGNALGQFENTVTSGILSGYGRDIDARDGGDVETLQNLFQTDAAINPGNSGGPLLNLNGEVIGINTAVADSAQNIGFAIPINDVKGLIAGVREKGKLERPYLGVRYISLTDDVAYYFNLETKRGAYVMAGNEGGNSVVPGSPAEKAGIKEKDIIVSINDEKIDERNSLVSILGRHGVGDTVKLKIIRDGKDITVDVKLEASEE